MRVGLFFLSCFFGGALLAAGCSYSPTSVQGIRLTSAHMRQIQIGRTTELDLIQLLGSSDRKERLPGGFDRLIYKSTEIKSLTFPGGYQAKGFCDKKTDEAFEIILKDGVVQSYRFIRP